MLGTIHAPVKMCTSRLFICLNPIKKTWSNMDYNYDVGHDYNEEIQESGNDDLLDNYAPDAAID